LKTYPFLIIILIHCVVAALLLWTLFTNSPVQPVWSSNAETLSKDEIGIRFGVHGNGSPNDRVTITTTKAHSGTESFMLTTDDGRVELHFYPSDLIENEFYFSWWTYIPSSVTAQPNIGEWLNIFQLEGSILPGWNPIYGICIGSWQAENNTTLFGLDNNNKEYPPNGVLADSRRTFPRDQWVHLEFYCRIGTNGGLQAWMNDAKLWSVSGIDTSGLHEAEMYFMPCIYGTNGTIYVDDMALYNVNMNGRAP
jgi:hypothetical protein